MELIQSRDNCTFAYIFLYTLNLKAWHHHDGTQEDWLVKLKYDSHLLKDILKIVNGGLEMLRDLSFINWLLQIKGANNFFKLGMEEVVRDERAENI